MAAKPASLIAYDAERFRGSTEKMRAIVDLWFAEEAETCAIAGLRGQRFHGRYITSHWSFTAFCFVFGGAFSVSDLNCRFSC